MPLPVDPQLLDRIYDAVLQPEGWTDVLDQAMRMYRASSAALFVQDLRTRRPELGVSIGVGGDKDTWTRFYDYYVFKNPVRIANLSRPVGEPTASNLLMSDEEYERLEYHREFQKSVGCFYELATHLVRDDRMLACFSIQRERKEGGFTLGEVDFVRSLYPHLRRAMMLRRRIGDESAATRSLERALHALSAPMCLLDGDSRLVFANAAAEAILSQGLGLSAKNGVLEPLCPADAQAWKRWLAAVSTHAAEGLSSGARLGLRNKRGDVVLHAWASPFRSPSGKPNARASHATTAVFLSRPDAPVTVSPARLQEYFGLTPAETRVLHGLVNGKAPKEIAADANLSADTIRAQMKSIYEKLEVHRQAELVQRVLLSPAVQIASNGA